MMAPKSHVNNKFQHGRLPGYEKGPSLAAIPNELLFEICGYLCLHCQLPHFIDIPHTTWEEGRVGQSSLVNLSRTCRHLRDIAQPILFHYYYSGDAPISPPGGLDLSQYINNNEMIENGKMISFLYSIISRPDLASSVKALALVAHLPPYSTGNCDVPNSTFRLFRDTADTIGLEGEIPCRWSVASLFWLQELAIGLLPSVRHLLLRRPQKEGYQVLQQPSQSLPNLKYLALLPTSGVDRVLNCALGRTDGLLLRACNLEELTVSDYYVQIVRPGPQPTLLPPRQTLRSLVLSSEDASSSECACPDHVSRFRWLQTRDYHELRGTRISTRLTFRTYSVLESLQIDQILLDGHIPGPHTDWSTLLGTYNPMTVLSKLPRGLKVLRVTAVICWPVMRKVLDALVRKAAVMFANLHEVETVSYVSIFDHQAYPKRGSRMPAIKDRFSEIGVSFTFRYSAPRTELPPCRARLRHL